MTSAATALPREYAWVGVYPGAWTVKDTSVQGWANKRQAERTVGLGMPFLSHITKASPKV